MSFQDIMEKMLHVIKGADGNDRYVPYITRSGLIPDINDPLRNDYDRIRDNGTFHGGGPI